jgi:hypothetical protein
MNGRTITILELLQSGAVTFGVFFTAPFQKIGADPEGNEIMITKPRRK